MSGHSKWATIKRQKGANDIKKGQTFTKLSNAITLAVKQGGNVSDINSNFKLRILVEAARQANMPKDNIERAISRATSSKGEDFTEALYEGFGPGGISVIVQTLTDNKQRTVAEVKNVFDKNGGSMGSQGSVMYQFEWKGLLTLPVDDGKSEEVLNAVIEAGADDFSTDETEVLVYTAPDSLDKVRTILKKKGIEAISSELIYKPINVMETEDSTLLEKIASFVEKMEDLNDVNKVFTNLG